MKNDTRTYRTTYLAAIIVCLCFLIGGILFVMILAGRSEEDNRRYLQDAAKQNQVTLLKQVQGDFQTLDGIAACIGSSGEEQQVQLRGALKTINEKNTFLRMGYVSSDGIADLYDISGITLKDVDLSESDFFLRAMAGERVITGALIDMVSNEYINYLTVPVYQGESVIGVLCAVNASSVYREIIDAPVLNGKGYTNIVDQEGNLVIRTQNLSGDPIRLSEMGVFEDGQLDQAMALLSGETGGQFLYKTEGVQQLAIAEPLGINGWSVISVVPRRILWENYGLTIGGVALIIVGAFAIFLFLLYRQGRIMSKSNAALLHQAYDDPLTGCRSFQKLLLDAEPLTSQKGEKKWAFWYCDLKKFKYFNDLLGYQTGDRVLQALARLLSEDEIPDALFCRVSADNFAGIRPYQDKSELEQWFRTLPVRLYETEPAAASSRMRVELCMGFFCPEADDDSLSLTESINRANMAQKTVKGQTGSRCGFFTRQIREKILSDAEIETRAWAALENGEFVLYMQPKVSIQNGGRIVGAEALSRWISPDRGMISPGDFIPLFEQSGFIVKLDRYNFELACRWMRSYLDAGNPPLNVAVNVSRLALLQDHFVEDYTAIKNRYRIPDRALELEFTESVVLDDDGVFLDTVVQLQKNGFICSLDDFGSGYSSLNLLKNLPIDVLKLDILFFRQGTDVTRERLVISHVLAMARDLNIRTIAEGVEEEDQVAFLRRAGCDVVQGYVFYKPMSLADFNQLAAAGLDLNLP